MTELPKLRKRLPSGTKVTMADVTDCPLVKLWTDRLVIVGWLVYATEQYVEIVSTVPVDEYQSGWRRLVYRKHITNVRVIAEPI